MIVTRDDCEKMIRMKGMLIAEFELKDLGKIKYFLGFEMVRSKTRLVLNKRKCSLDPLK